MTLLDSPIPRFHLAIPVDDLTAARHFYGSVLGLADRLRVAGVAFVIEPYVRFAGETGEQWTGFTLDGPTRPAGNAMEFKAFADDSRVFAH